MTNSQTLHDRILRGLQSHPSEPLTVADIQSSYCIGDTMDSVNSALHDLRKLNYVVLTQSVHFDASHMPHIPDHARMTVFHAESQPDGHAGEAVKG